MWNKDVGNKSVLGHLPGDLPKPGIEPLHWQAGSLPLVPLGRPLVPLMQCISVIWAPIRNAESQDPPQTSWIRICIWQGPQMIPLFTDIGEAPLWAEQPRTAIFSNGCFHLWKSLPKCHWGWKHISYKHISSGWVRGKLSESSWPPSGTSHCRQWVLLLL